MSWFEPPPLVPKRDLRKELPKSVSLKRIRILIVGAALFGAIAFLLLAGVVLLIFRTGLMPHRVTILLVFGIIGACIGAFMALRALRVVLEYGIAMEKKNPQV